MLGATGYVGVRLVSRLLHKGYRVRAAMRAVDKTAGDRWAEKTRLAIVEADIHDPVSVERAAQGCCAAFYLDHSKTSDPSGAEEAGRQSAVNMQKAAAEVGLDRIVYLGNFGETQHKKIDAIMKLLQAGPVPVTTFRTSMIIGAGSPGFEILRHLAARLPMMVTPRWVYTPFQPIAIHNVIGYMTGCLSAEKTRGRMFDIGGPDIVSFHGLIDIYAETAGLAKRMVLPAPVFMPGLSAKWIQLLTPVSAATALAFTEARREPSVRAEKRVLSIVPQRLIGCREAIRMALEEEGGKGAETF